MKIKLYCKNCKNSFEYSLNDCEELIKKGKFPAPSCNKCNLSGWLTTEKYIKETQKKQKELEKKLDSIPHNEWQQKHSLKPVAGKWERNASQERKTFEKDILQPDIIKNGKKQVNEKFIKAYGADAHPDKEVSDYYTKNKI